VPSTRKKKSWKTKEEMVGSDLGAGIYQQDSNLSMVMNFVRCTNGMARPQVADGGDGLQIYRGGGVISNISSGQLIRGDPPVLVLGVALETLYFQRQNSFKGPNSKSLIIWQNVR
jgi:hypothetical protein